MVVYRGHRIAWPPLNPEDHEVVESLVAGEREEAKIMRDFASKEEDQRQWDLSDAKILAQSEFLQVSLIGGDPAPPYEE